ncbi:IS3 family transposase [Pseudarthrobacter sp.]|uniref:IS3 family transposase n=1 Tax=Pseudarthrobacter sp. TaxID=1934409 RepID=UPI002FC5E58E
MVSACKVMGVSRPTWYRHRAPRAVTPVPVPQKERVQPATLTGSERARIKAFLIDEESANLSVSQVFYRTLDQGVYVASESSWHRVARASKLNGDRRVMATHKPKVIPELCASRPNQVWSWDITVLRSVDRGRNFRLYVILDVFSRYVVGWRLEPSEGTLEALDMITDALAGEHSKPEVLHADRGSVMTSIDMGKYLAKLGIVQSHSRPRVSNDNPFSESQFKTMKYDLDYPQHFRSLEHAREWTTGFIHAYNTEHRHSGIGYYTPESVHEGTWPLCQKRRQAALDAAWAAYPHRHHQRPRAHKVHTESWINNPQKRANRIARLSQRG